MGKTQAHKHVCWTDWLWEDAIGDDDDDDNDDDDDDDEDDEDDDDYDDDYDDDDDGGVLERLPMGVCDKHKQGGSHFLSSPSLHKIQPTTHPSIKCFLFI